MTSSKFTKILTAAAVLASLFAAANARADGRFVAITLGDYDGHRMQYRHIDRDDGFRPFRPATGYNYVDMRQSELRERIEYGIRSGELTPRESARLLAEQREIERLQRAYQRDGRLDQFERQHLRAELREANRNIWCELNDRQDRGDYRRHPHGHR